MTEDQSGHETTHSDNPSAGDGGAGSGRMAASPGLWGCLATGVFYLAIPYSPIASDLLNRYFCSHPL